MWLELELRAGKKKGPETSHCKNRHLGTSQSHSRRNGQTTARSVRQRPARNEMREMRGFQAALALSSRSASFLQRTRSSVA